MMKKRTLVISLLLANGFAAANEQVKAPDALNYSVNGVYSYNNFDFNSTKGDGFNRYKGHANFYGVGGNNVKLNERFSAGLFAYWVNTKVHSKLLLPGFSLSDTNQSITNNSLFGHILAHIDTSYFFDLAGGYGQNTGHFQTQVFLPGEIAKQATANNHGNNWFISGAALYSKKINSFKVNANIGVLHMEVNQRPYDLNFADYIAYQFVERAKTSVTFILENAEIGYQANPMFQPFINGGLLQVANFSTNQNIPSNFIGPIPGLNLDKNGYKIGGGLSLSYQQYLLRVEQQYFKRGSIYSSNQTTLTLTAFFS
ncbi:MAG: autotransporter outer membrane beta-barrel domain-containing protein [Proteobacteria bacterium]|nr:autotransporter outer membrane beta-barrel domain-containing protein [Pseudomonadota bacterium]